MKNPLLFILIAFVALTTHASEYAILNPDRTVRETRHFQDLPPHKPGRVLPVIEDAKPDHDPATHRIVEAGLIVEADKVRRTFRVEARPAAELAEQNTESEIDAIESKLAAGTALTPGEERAFRRYVLKRIRKR